MTADASKVTCACCGHRTLEAPAKGSYQICPVCFWEDAPRSIHHYPHETGTNSVSLRQAQRNFASFGAAEPVFRDAVRPPAQNEPRSPDWRTEDELRADASRALLDEIEEAFGSVTRENGISLHQALAIDDWADDEAQERARQLDTDANWRQVPPAWLEHSEALTYYDPVGWRYYLPAYMRWWIEGGNESDCPTSDSLLWDLDMNQDAGGWAGSRNTARLSALNSAQRGAVAHFLRFVERFSDDAMQRETAARALQRLWKRFE